MPTLLVVDDDRHQRRKVIRAAQVAGFDASDITEAENLEAAKAIIQDRSFDVAVVDVVLTLLPEKVGLMLISELRTEQPRCKIIALTTKGGTDFGVEAMRAGADDFVSSKWEYVNWYALLEQRLRMWRGIAEEYATRDAN